VFKNATGTLDFYYQVSDAAGSATALGNESDTNFLGYSPAVAFSLTGGSYGAGFTNGTTGEIPVTANLDASGTTVDFAFEPVPPGTKIPPGTTSGVFIISTTATNFTAGNAEVLDGGSQIVAAFQPAAAPPSGVPEPATYALFGSGLLAFAGIRRVIAARSK
jgi:hypothetical protein